jgi:hypothetical protein
MVHVDYFLNPMGVPSSVIWTQRKTRNVYQYLACIMSGHVCITYLIMLLAQIVNTNYLTHTPIIIRIQRHYISSVPRDQYMVS